MGDGQGLVRTAGDGEGQRGTVGTARVMSHDATMIRLEVYDFNSSQYRRELMGLSIQ